MIYALWHGGINYAHGYVDSDLERFGSVREAVAAYESRRDSGYWLPQEFQYVTRDPEDTLTPCADEGSTMTLWNYDPRETGDPYPWKIISTGPRGGTRVEVA